MSTLEHLRSGLNRAWETMTLGWHEFVERAGDALTHFHPSKHSSPTGDAAIEQGYSRARWGVIPADVVTDREHVYVSLEIPGMEAGDFEIHVRDQTLVVHGEKTVENERIQGRYHVMERAYGSFERVIALPVPAADAGASARYQRGVLQVTLPRSPIDKSKRIEVFGE